jgi:hypothetical protein
VKATQESECECYGGGDGWGHCCSQRTDATTRHRRSELSRVWGSLVHLYWTRAAARTLLARHEETSES